VLASGAGAFLVREVLQWLKPHLPHWWVAVVSAMQYALGYIPLHWFALVALGLAVPLIWDSIVTRGEALQGYARVLRTKLPFGVRKSVVEREQPTIELSCRVREQEQLPKGSPLTKWVQIVVNPVSADLVDCEAQIVVLNRNDEHLYDEPLNCTWSNWPEIRRTIRVGIPQSANLCMADAGKPGLYLTTSINKPQIMEAMCKPESAIYRVDVAVYAANSKTKRQWFIIEYGGDFTSIEIRPETI
jgi:hypothetical protein